VLHEPHAEVRESGCISALKILTSARAILDMIYAVWSSSYDISLLESFCAVSCLLPLIFPLGLKYVIRCAGSRLVGFS